MDLTDEQWAVLEPLIGEIPTCLDRRGRPWRSSCEVLNGILWILRTGAQWADLPERYPPNRTCHRRYQRWDREGLFERFMEALAANLKAGGKPDISECFIGGTFIEKQSRLMRGSDQAGQRDDTHGRRQAGGPRWSSSRHVCRLVYASRESPRPLDSRFVDALPQRGNRKRPKTQHGRPLRGDRRRWKIERLFAWLGNFRRLVVRYKRHALNSLGFAQLGCSLILLRY